MGAGVYNNGKLLEEVLGPERTKDIRHRLEMGENAKGVARLIHKDWNFFEDKARSTVEAMVHRYRRNITSKILVRRVERAMGAHKHVKALDTMEELTSLIRQQRTRIESALAMEAKAKGMLMSQTGIEMRLLKDLCKDLGHLQLETGVMTRAPKTVNGAFRDENGKTTAFTWTESDESLLDNLENGIPILEGVAMPAIAEDDE